MELKGKNALVTGAAHRVGKAIALRLAQEGCNVAIHYHGAKKQADQTLDELKALAVQAGTYHADLGSVPAIMGLFEEVEQDFERLDILINSAAIMQRRVFSEVSLHDWNASIDLNLRAPFFCTQQAVKLMGTVGGAIVNISDIAGLQPWVHFPVHSISKTGVEMLTKLAALAFAPKVRVNAVAPGPVLKPTHMQTQRWDQIGHALPLGRPGTPEDVTQAVLFLIKNDFITGETLVVDGGNRLI
jgi:NAD(P)-dependent dehydrogenase (short-subunit alcohol dehydrogenase family)